MKKILEVNIPNEGDNFFPMNIYVVNVPDHFEVDTSWIVPILEENNWDEMYAIIETYYDNPEKVHIQISALQPEWITRGNILFEEAVKQGKINAEDIAGEDDESIASIYVHHKLLELTGAVGIFSWRW